MATVKILEDQTTQTVPTTYGKFKECQRLTGKDEKLSLKNIYLRQTKDTNTIQPYKEAHHNITTSELL